ncbi:nose resistant to fluoxetine protein 6-like [Mercenaria mercenaria]|uniref:nose resistant to fluoxetine protein 6-like n=1 Tax=Mercenaria mercenaria TaxID=6596 RepID=UPI00234EEACC|nr:nose resistant to fluoxetine protein 6-like [Mercenaria mercenaria]
MFRYRGLNVVHLAYFVTFVSISCSLEQSIDIDLRHIGLPVYMKNTHTNETLLFQSLLKSHASSNHRFSSVVEILAKLREIKSEGQLTEYCQSDTELLLNDTSSKNSVNDAFVKYVDAAAKVPRGILQGKWNWVGDYQECHDIETLHNPKTNKSFKGEYSSVAVLLNGKPVLLNTYPIVLGVCFPNSCDETDVKNLMNKLISTIKTKISPFVPAIAQQNITAYESASGEHGKLDSGAIAMIVVIGVLCFIVLLATLIDYTCSSSEKETDKLVSDDSTFADSHEDRTGLLSGELFSHSIQEGRCNAFKQKLLNICRVFSVTSNGKKLFGTTTAVGPLACLNGLRVMSMWWVILGHTYAFIFAVVDNLAEAAQLVQRFTFQPIMNGTYSVDSFFFLSGLLVAYLALKEIKEKGKLSWPYYFLHRYWRLTPLYAFVILYYTYLMIPSISGPLRFFIALGPYKEMIDICKSKWWTNLLYINNMYPNYGNLGTTCMGWSWYLANDMQFYIVLGPIVIVSLSLKGRLRYIGVFITVFLILAGVLIRGVLVWYYGIYGNSNGASPTKHVDDPWGKNGALYGRPYARFSVYLVGMLTGYVLASNNNRIRIHRVLAVVGWCVAIATALAVIYGMYYYNHHTGTHMTLVQSAFYNALGRTAWGMCLSWVVIACISGNGGPVKDILSWKFWAPLGRLTYAAYLVHPIIIYTYYFSMFQPLHFSDLTMVYLFIANLVMSYLVAFIVSMLVEAPMIQLEKLLLPSMSSFGNRYVSAPLSRLVEKVKDRLKRS